MNEVVIRLNSTPARYWLPDPEKFLQLILQKVFGLTLEFTEP
jgi:hypothetical protein